MPGNRRSDRRRGQGGLTQGKLSHESVRERAENRSERTAVFGKTKMCKFYILGVCAKGTDCAFAHHADEMKTIPDLSCTKICKTLINTGVCDDPDCMYAHNKEELRNVPGVPTDFPNMELPQSGNAPRAGGKGKKGNIHPTMPGAPLIPMAAGLPVAMPPMAMPTGQNLDPQQQQALALQQMAQMQLMAMQMAQMMAQNQDAQARGTEGYMTGMPAYSQGAAPGDSFLYNALFSGAVPHTSDSSSGPVHKTGLMNNRKAAQRRGTDSPQASTPKGVLCSCGSTYLPDAKFCRVCGLKREELKKPVPYNVKNTFIDVQEPSCNSPHPMRNVKSASARLYNLVQDDSPPAGEGLTSASLAAAMGDSSDSLGLNLPPMPRNNTWASDLDALKEEEDCDTSPMVAQPANVHGLPSSEKRLQDTPFGAANSDPVNSGGSMEGRGDGRQATESADGSRGRGEGSDELAEPHVVIKNTFIEYKQQPMGGMRQVQTAAGRLDMMANE